MPSPSYFSSRIKNITKDETMVKFKNLIKCIFRKTVDSMGEGKVELHE